MCNKKSHQIFLLFTITFFFPYNLFPQWSTDPNNNLIIGYGLNPELCSDSTGGCYITYEVGYPSKLYLHRLDKYGYQPWGDKRIIAGELDEQSNAKIIGDGEGGVIVSYGDRIMNNSYRLRLQKVDSIGNFLWGPTGVKVSITDTRQSVQRLVTDGEGGCVIVWIDTLAEYKINRINNFAQRVWSDSGKVIAVDEYYNKPQLVRASDGNYYVQIRENLYRISKNGDIVLQDSTTLIIIVPDSEGGVVQSGRVWTGLISKLVAQRKDSLGNNLWQEPYVEIADSLYLNTQMRIQFNNGYYFYGWSGTKNGVNRIAQFQALRSDGSKLFPEGSIQISENTPIGSPYIIQSDSARTILIWNDATLSSSTIAQMYDTLGNKLWNENGIVVSYPAIANQNTTDEQGGFISSGPIDQFTIVAQQVNKYGRLGEIITSFYTNIDDNILSKIILYQNYPNPFNSSTTIRYQLPKDNFVSLKVYDVLGSEVETLLEENKKAGYYTLKVSLNNLSSGIYFYKLTAGENNSTKKLILLK